jgi:7-cyano-7-deazaguanine synthase
MIVPFSGGVCSTVYLYDLLHRRVPVTCITVDYGQLCRHEITVAAGMCQALGVKHHTLKLPDLQLLLGTSAEPFRGRRMVIQSLCSAFAAAGRGTDTAYLETADTKPGWGFSRSLCAFQNEGLADKVGLDAPFVEMARERVVQLGLRLGVPFGDTWSCLRGGSRHCGTCRACLARQRSFRTAGVSDPTLYRMEDPDVLTFPYVGRPSNPRAG